MDTLRLLVQNLIILVILVVILEMLLPNGDMRRYTRMVMGLMVIVAVIQAISGFSGGSLFKEVKEYTWRSAPQQANTLNILEQGRQLDADNRKQAVEQYKKGVENQIFALVGIDGKVKLVEAKLKIQDDPSKKDFGRIQEVQLTLGKDSGVETVKPVSVTVSDEKPSKSTDNQPPPEYKEAARKAIRVLGGFYNLPEEQIKVQFQD